MQAKEFALRSYNDETANDPIVHCNRFPSWDELPIAERRKRIAVARAALKGTPHEQG